MRSPRQVLRLVMLVFAAGLFAVILRTYAHQLGGEALGTVLDTFRGLVLLLLSFGVPAVLLFLVAALSSEGTDPEGRLDVRSINRSPTASGDGKGL